MRPGERLERLERGSWGGGFRSDARVGSFAKVENIRHCVGPRARLSDAVEFGGVGDFTVPMPRWPLEPSPRIFRAAEGAGCWGGRMPA